MYNIHRLCMHYVVFHCKYLKHLPLNYRYTSLDNRLHNTAIILGINLYLYTNTYTQIHTHKYIYTNIYIYAFMHTQTHHCMIYMGAYCKVLILLFQTSTTCYLHHMPSSITLCTL